MADSSATAASSGTSSSAASVSGLQHPHPAPVSSVRVMTVKDGAAAPQVGPPSPHRLSAADEKKKHVTARCATFPVALDRLPSLTPNRGLEKCLRRNE